MKIWVSQEIRNMSDDQLLAFLHKCKQNNASIIGNVFY